MGRIPWERLSEPANAVALRGCWFGRDRPVRSVSKGAPEMSRASGSCGAGVPNTLVAALAAAASLLIISCFDPVPAGEDLAAARGAGAGVAAGGDVPVPPEARHLLPLPSAGDEVRVPVPTEPEDIRPVLSGQIGDESRTFFLLMVMDGERFLSNVREYSAVFSKQERLGGDLSDVQQIDMKVRHAPEFGVYMKWRNGDAGRQVLYSESYEDGKLAVKLGGFKGRLLPAIKLDPKGDEAMAESRHPITEAGILFLARRLIEDRRAELTGNLQVKCTRLENTSVGDRPCFQFQFDYADAQSSPEYRRSVAAIDAQYHIPLQVRNWTWGTGESGLTELELDEQTLVESYSFSSLNFGVQYADSDFSRENPKYRM